MRDEEYQPDQIPEYGQRAQPAVAARMESHVRMTQAGTLLASLAVLLAAVGVAAYPEFGPSDTDYRGGRAGGVWAVVALATAVAMLAICLIQINGWRQALRIWRGELRRDLRAYERLSWVAHGLSYAVLLLAVVAVVLASSAASWSATASLLLAAALLAMLVAQPMAAVQYLRAGGPPGTLPAHMRRLVARNR